MTAAVSFDNVSVAYDRHIALKGVTGSFAPGSVTAIAGPNGAGKSTLLKALMQDLPLASGAIDRGGLRREDFGYLPQATQIERQFPLTVAETVMLGAWRETGGFRGLSRRMAERGMEALKAVGLQDYGRKHIGALSSGQFQRVLFARLLLQDPKFIILDEPFTAIDATTTRDLLAIITHWKSESRTIVAVLHDFDQVRAHFPQTLLLSKEAIGWGATDMVMSSANLMRAKALSEDMAPAFAAVM
ncbi:ABC transporter ATP-binding protein [Neorhizobium sp. NCHU2750]|uniref:metal ABC transporter ATP-binding protein n=1 Tax=Neorhizobium sp. NCHU2750 TaxID=1825976 RepID=UPI000E72F7EC|nr:zinc/manganese ABC transporter ATP-binding protein [Neorhizobium sp. NCHU2750]